MDRRSIAPDKQAQESDRQDVLARIHPALRDSFVALPSDTETPLTPGQMAALFAGNKNAWADYLRDLWRDQLQDH